MNRLQVVTNFEDFWHEIAEELASRPPTEVGEWQSQKTEQPMLELYNVSFQMPIPMDIGAQQEMIKPNLPWAEDHFKERVSGEPLNPPPSEAWWPFAQQGNAEHKSEGEKFSHTYPERMWPKYAAGRDFVCTETGEVMHGIRFDYGDLEDVVNQMIKTPLTRQAYLPIWFPEDTGAVHGKRVPCTLGYHFMFRNGELQITYYIRSCDAVRHMRDDVYMAARLALWMSYAMGDMVDRINLVMHIANLHGFAGDKRMLDYRVKDYKQAKAARLMSAF